MMRNRGEMRQSSMRSEVPRKCENPILKGKERNRQGEIGNNLDHDFAESSTAILNAPNSAVSWIFSLPPVESRCSVVAK